MIKSIALLALLLPVSAFATLFDAETAISQANSEKLVYVGKFIPHWSASGTMPSCLYKNSKVFVLSHYCVQRDIPAASIRIHSRDYKLGHINIYAEGVAGGDISTQIRSDYFDPLWKLSASPNSAGFDFNITAQKYYEYEKLESSDPFRGCMTNDYFPDSLCDEGYENEHATWGQSSVEFRKSPSKNWYLLLKTLKSLVPKSPEMN